MKKIMTAVTLAILLHSCDNRTPELPAQEKTNLVLNANLEKILVQEETKPKPAIEIPTQEPVTQQAPQTQTQEPHPDDVVLIVEETQPPPKPTPWNPRPNPEMRRLLVERHRQNAQPQETVMKKLLTQTLALLPLGSCLLASTPSTPEEEAFWRFSEASSYDGPKDETTQFNPSFNLEEQVPYNYYDRLIMNTSLGTLARSADLIAVGRVTNKDVNHFTISVENALVGCTNDASIVIRRELWDFFRIAPMINLNDALPANNSQIVVAAYTNMFICTNGEIQWDTTGMKPGDTIENHLALRSLTRSWWPVERDDGVLLTQFTNVVQAARIAPNWTNYFHLVRDGAASTSARVQEDSFKDMRRLVIDATPEQRQIIFADPLVDASHKTLP